LRDEYNQPKEVNFDIKVTAKMSLDKKIDLNTIKVYHNQSPKGPPDWVALEETFPN
jgi:hypothetical protein